LTQAGEGQLDAMLVGGANVLTKLGAGQLTAGLLGGANVLTHISQGDEAADTRAGSTDLSGSHGWPADAGPGPGTGC
ncbi:hypothetical protein, partial [Aeromonas salmonicida]|uniref:hypothetical protein n=1 Tax=Aeromonas salmonicida TaxID=645 RepID=UPI003D3179E4